MARVDEQTGTDLGQAVAKLRAGTPQRKWAERFGLSYGALRDLEQGRVRPSRTMALLVKAIELAPDFMEAVARVVTGRAGHIEPPALDNVNTWRIRGEPPAELPQFPQSEKEPRPVIIHREEQQEPAPAMTGNERIAPPIQQPPASAVWGNERYFSQGGRGRVMYGPPVRRR